MSTWVERGKTAPGSSCVRWYCWRDTAGGPRKERLSHAIKRLQSLGHHDQASRILDLAVQQGYRLRSK